MSTRVFFIHNLSTPAERLVKNFLASLTRRDDIRSVLLDRGRQPVTLVDGAGAAPEGSASSVEPPGALGDTARPNYMGPSGNGLVERMKAGETPWNQGRS